MIDVVATSGDDEREDDEELEGFVDEVWRDNVEPLDSLVCFSVGGGCALLSTCAGLLVEAEGTGGGGIGLVDSDCSTSVSEEVVTLRGGIWGDVTDELADGLGLEVLALAISALNSAHPHSSEVRSARTFLSCY